MATPSPEGSSCKEPGSRRICSFGDSSVGITFPLTLAGFATIAVLPSLLYVPIEENARAPSRFKVTRDALRSSKPASYLSFLGEEGQKHLTLCADNAKEPIRLF